MLYEVIALEYPGAPEYHIANIVLDEQMVTSKWADEKMFFRHSRMDDDLRFHPEWASELTPFLHDSDLGVGKIRPPHQKVRQSCPFAFLFIE